MKISIKKTGGFAGIIETIIDTDTTQLPIEIAKQIEHLAQQIILPNSPDTISEELIGADIFLYEVTITHNTQHHTINFPENNNPKTALLKKLIQKLN